MYSSMRATVAARSRRTGGACTTATLMLMGNLHRTMRTQIYRSWRPPASPVRARPFGPLLHFLHMLERGRIRPAVELEPVALLVGAEREPRLHAGLAVDLV